MNKCTVSIISLVFLLEEPANGKTVPFFSRGAYLSDLLDIEGVKDITGIPNNPLVITVEIDPEKSVASETGRIGTEIENIWNNHAKGE